MAEIEIEGESYALDKIPSDSSDVVRAENGKVARSNRFKSFGQRS